MNEKRIEHIADLAKLYIKDEEYDKYEKQTNDILKEIDKILSVEIPDCDIMISPCEEINKYNDDIVENHISTTDALKNAKRVKGDYITVPKVIEEEK